MEAPVAIRRLDTDREDVFAFDVVGHINASDVENYDGVEWDAALKDFNLLGKTHALKHIRLYAVVGGPAWVGPMIAVFNPFFRVKMKHFDETEEEAAWKWIGAREIPIKV
jgi:hypothetical protein